MIDLRYKSANRSTKARYRVKKKATFPTFQGDIHINEISSNIVKK